MTLQAGFAETDITPPLGTQRLGWLKVIVGTSVRDPLHARVAILRDGEKAMAFIQLDTLCVRWTQTQDIRCRIANHYGFCSDAIMVAATHNHAGPAVANAGDARRDDTYVEILTSRIVDAFGAALAGMRDAELGLGSCFEFGVSHNRRVVMRDGTVRTHGTFDDPEALRLESTIDPELAVLAVRGTDGKRLGLIANFACHPTHYGGDTCFSAGFPGVFANAIKAEGWPVSLFLNGAAGDIHTSDPCAGGADLPMEKAGSILAENACRVAESLEYVQTVRFKHAVQTVNLPYRQYTEEDIAGTVRGAQRFVDPAIYDRGMPGLLARIQERRTQPAEVQTLFVNDWAFAGIPGEYFVRNGLRIKEETHPTHALVVGWANGMVGYIPHREAFLRGGYETTFASHSRMGIEAGDMLADCAIAMIRRHSDAS